MYVLHVIKVEDLVTQRELGSLAEETTVFKVEGGTTTSTQTGRLWRLGEPRRIEGNFDKGGRHYMS